ncbi:urease accessory UreF family protein [Halorhabdus sp. BNX81]|uniref:urease accessory protein UreF n=1 Tax=Halorhabdus sp. BNX81 TaxID=2980181 RepID=UPI0023DD58AF|nr:urease accessory UreF family protein [Halorhabdus sp. BNX81]WEL22253.1 Urease accessory protein UreF [Halorhabdus sp. BNX81]
MSDGPAFAAMRLADSMLPTGSDSLSYGLEQLVAEDRVTDAADLRQLLETVLARQLAVCDAVAVRAARQAAGAGDLDRVVEIDRRVLAVTLPAEFRESTRASGRRLLDLSRETLADDRISTYAARVDDAAAPGTYPAAFALVAAVEGLDGRQAAGAFVHAFVASQLQAAQRLLTVGHTDLQRLLVDLRPAMTRAVATSAERSAADLQSFTPGIETAAARHEDADRRLFLS